MKFLKLLKKQKLDSLNHYIKNLCENDIAIDCGANVGKVTSELASTGATVYAFEPNIYAFNKLYEKFEGSNNVHCINKGVWDKDTSMNLYYHENSDDDEIHWSTGSSILSAKGNIRSDKFKEVEIIDLAKFIKSLDKPIKILKIDVEGAEYEILEKLIRTGLVNQIEQLFVETHEHINGLKEKDKAIRALIKSQDIKNINLEWI